MIDANRIVDHDKNKREATLVMENFLRQSKLGDTVHIQLQYEEARNRFNIAINEKEGWQPQKMSKKYNLAVHCKRFEVNKKINVFSYFLKWSDVWMYKIVTTFKTNFEQVKELITDVRSGWKDVDRLIVLKQVNLDSAIENRYLYMFFLCVNE